MVEAIRYDTTIHEARSTLPVEAAIAGNAVENVVGIQLAARNHADYAVSVIVNSPIQIALVLAPALVLLSFLTATTLTLVFAPLFAGALLELLSVMRWPCVSTPLPCPNTTVDPNNTTISTHFSAL